MRRMYMIVALGLVAMGLTAGCENKEIKNTPAAKVKTPAATTGKKAETKPAATTGKKVEEKKGAAAAGGTALAIAAHPTSTVGWLGAKASGDSHEGGFSKFSGTITLGKDGKVSAVAFDVDTASLMGKEGEPAKLIGHLKADDFLAVAKFPKATFTSTSITEKAAGDATHEVVGNMEIRGIKKEISFPATIKVAADKVEAKTQFKMKRFQFDIKYAGKKDNLINDDVVIKVHAVAPKKG